MSKDKDIEVKFVVEQEPPSLEEKMENYFESGRLIRICFGPPDSSAILQSIRGMICAAVLWMLIFMFLKLLIVATDMFI